jgi:hypothetical protein
MSTIRLTVTPELRKTLDWLRVFEYPTLTDAEILKATAGQAAVRRRRATKEVDYSDPTPGELMLQTGYVFTADEEDGDIPEVDLSKLKPINRKDYV